MSVFVLKNAKIFLAGYDISGDLNKVTLNHKIEEKDNTVFGATGKGRIAGLSDSSVKVGGFWQADSMAYKIDDILHSKFSAVDEVISIYPQTLEYGKEYGYSMKCIEAEYSMGGQVGDLFGFDLSAMSNDLLVRNNLVETGVKTITGAGGSLKLGAVSSTQKVYAGIHVLAISGTNPTLDIKVQSDDNPSCTSTTDQITMATMTDIGSQWATPSPGVIADEYWRFSFIIGGTSSPSFTIRAWIGIQ